MTLILNGTDNSATTPAVTGTDTDTGVYYPAANQVGIATNGTLALLVDASQNLIASAGRIQKTGTATSISLNTGEAYGASNALAIITTDSGASAINLRMYNVSYYYPFQFASNGAMSVGGATATTSGAGITFPATQSASSNANTLDDYEEGTWTPTVNYSGGTFNASAAYYTKVGRLVNISLTINYNSSAGVGVNLNSISGLPFQNGSSQSVPAPCGLFYIMTTSTGDNNTCFPGFILGGSSTDIALYTSQSGSTEGRPRFNSVNAYMQINCTYVSA